LLPTKLPHYVLPAYPALALLCGAALIDLTDRVKAAWSVRILFVLCAGGLAALSAYLSTLMFGDAVASERRAIQAAMLGAPLVVGGLLLVWRAKRPALVVLTGCAAIILFNWSARDRILPEARPWLVSAEASSALMRAGLHPRLSPGAGGLTSVGFNEPSFVFLTRTDTDLGEGAEAAASIKPGGAAIVEARQAPAFEAGLRTRGLAFEPIGAPIVGFNYSNGDEVSLQPGRVSSAGERAP
jgi:4-amino-4-deoxy-L-arabinose transferase-like glycosyltransferase